MCRESPSTSAATKAQATMQNAPPPPFMQDVDPYITSELAQIIRMLLLVWQEHERQVVKAFTTKNEASQLFSLS